jgi:hypothetical protein
MKDPNTATVIDVLTKINPLMMFSAATSLLKLVVLVLVILAVITLIVALMRRASGGRRSGLLPVLSAIALCVAVAGVIYDFQVYFATRDRMREMAGTMFNVCLVESGYVIGLGIVVWLISQFGNAGVRRA